jgi:hypothetical protein
MLGVSKSCGWAGRSSEMAIQFRFICDGCGHTEVNEEGNPPEWHERKVVVTISDGTSDNKLHEGRFDLCPSCKAQLTTHCDPRSWPRLAQTAPWFDEIGLEDYEPPPAAEPVHRHLDADYSHSKQWYADRLRDNAILER